MISIAASSSGFACGIVPCRASAYHDVRVEGSEGFAAVAVAFEMLAPALASADDGHIRGRSDPPTRRPARREGLGDRRACATVLAEADTMIIARKFCANFVSLEDRDERCSTSADKVRRGG